MERLAGEGHGKRYETAARAINNQFGRLRQ